MEEIEVVAFACRGTLVDWTGAIDAVAYELARRNGESPLDRGAALGRRVEALADGDGLARGFERLAAERGYLGEESVDESVERVVALARPSAAPARLCDRGSVREAGGRRIPHRGRPRLAAFRRCVRGRRHGPARGRRPTQAIMYVSAAEWRRVEARRRGMRVAAPHELGPALAATATIMV